MARNGLQAVETKQPDELYDSLSQDGQDTWDAIAVLGYTPEKGLKGLWFARKTGEAAKDAIGPADSLAALYSQVKAALPDDHFDHADDVVDLDDLPPSDRLPGMEEPAIEELDRMGDNCIALKERRDQAKTEFDDACDLMRQKMNEHKRKRYNRRGFSLVVEESEKLVIKKAEQPKQKRQTAKAA
jgi:hypothetical protein